MSCLKIITGLTLLLPLCAHADFEWAKNEAAPMDRSRLWHAVDSGRVFEETLAHRMSSFDLLPGAARKDYFHWKDDILSIPLERTESHYRERVQKSYSRRCLSFEQLRDRRLGGEKLSSHKLRQLEETRDPLEEGGTVDNLASKASNTCIMQKYRSVRQIPSDLRAVYFPESAAQPHRYHFLGNIKHEDAHGVRYLVAQIPRHAITRALIQRSEFENGKASHLQLRLSFSQDIVLRDQAIAKQEAPLLEMKTDELVFSVEAAASAEDNSKNSLVSSLFGTYAEESFAFKGSAFILKTASSAVRDAILAKSDPRLRRVYQYPLHFFSDRQQNRKRFEGLFLDLIGAAESHGLHTSYNLLRRHCGIWLWKIIDAHLGKGRLKPFDFNVRLPNRVEKAIQKRSIGGSQVQIQGAGQFLRYPKDHSSLPAPYLFWIDEICERSPTRFPKLNCQRHSPLRLPTAK